MKPRSRNIPPDSAPSGAAHAHARDSDSSTKDAKRTGAPSDKQITPSMAQFLEIKAANPDSILWYRMGDFYELFFEDAKVVAEALSITLTKRGKHLGEDIPMCGVPVVRADEYLHKLIKKGFRVAVCEQLEDPAAARKRGSKAIVKRDVVRLVTPGTLTEDTLLDASARNFLCALFIPRQSSATTTKTSNQTAIAAIDISTGEFEIGIIDAADLPGELVRLNPSELIVSDESSTQLDCKSVLDMLKTAITPVPHAHFDSLSGERDLKDLFKVSDLGAFGNFERAELCAIAALLKYVHLTQIGAKPFTRPPRKISTNDNLLIDAASRTSLELTQSASGDSRTSLLNAIDKTVTGPGARELAARLTSPLCDVAKINARLDSVAQLFDNASLRADLRSCLKKCPDLARSISRLVFSRGTAKDLANVRDTLAVARECTALLCQNAGVIGLPHKLQQLTETLATPPEKLADILTRALIPEPSGNKRDTGYIARGYSKELDEAVNLKTAGRAIIAGLEREYASESGIKTLKIRHNNILGYFIEVSKSNAEALLTDPLNKTFRHRQSIATAARFTTDKLDETQTKIATAAERADELEQTLFNDLAHQISTHETALASIAAALADLDVFAALAEIAQLHNYTRPLVDDTRTFTLEGARHPVVEQALNENHQPPFIENDCILNAAPQNSDEKQGADTTVPPGFDDKAQQFIWLVTGPNMAGKSTFLRQNALITILAQIGSFVPAAKAHIGVVDRLFSRVGASDDLARGRSTFMVEMVETASILNLATDKSLVILDEIGRGTATFDGLSIAWACVEYLHNNTAARTLFATHYHELTILPERLTGVANVTIDVKEWRDEIIFLHKVRAGAADRSYGIQVAKLAGIPKPVVERAREVLEILEAHDQAGATSRANPLEELPLFAATSPRSGANTPTSQSTNGETELISRVMDALEGINPDDLSPREALDIMYNLKKLSRDT